MKKLFGGIAGLFKGVFGIFGWLLGQIKTFFSSPRRAFWFLVITGAILITTPILPILGTVPGLMATGSFNSLFAAVGFGLLAERQKAKDAEAMAKAKAKHPLLPKPKYEYKREVKKESIELSERLKKRQQEAAPLPKEVQTVTPVKPENKKENKMKEPTVIEIKKPEPKEAEPEIVM